MAIRIGKYFSIGTNDVDRAKAFYEGLLRDQEETTFENDEGFMVWTDGAGTTFGVYTPFDGNPATAGNGSMTGFVVDTREEVHSLYAKALELGAKDEGAPGLRLPNFYGAYVRDPDGNKLVFCKID